LYGNNLAGVLIDFISIPVTVGFTSATSVIIVVSQLKGLLGLKISSQGFLDTLIKVLQNISDASLWDTAMSVSCIMILLFFRVMR
jgi:sodium-independent sulfate anion transporter 11